MIDRRHVLGFITAALLATPAFAQQQATKAEAVALLDAAIAHIRKVGHEKAFADFNSNKATWTKHDLYIVGFTMNAIAVVHGLNPKVIGRDFSQMRTPTDMFLIQEMARQAKSSPAGAWVDYDWVNPTTKELDHKSALVRKVPDFDGFISVNVYR